ncbi:DMT family transporter [Yoonia sp. 208BN28-4]|uniref:DMT family transporter n=1 Tax=Yoonia sp. 208BN28-4 TaxID=3126505 RepID=UPI0030B1AFF6
MPTHYIALIFAVIFETVGTTALQASQQFTRFWPAVLCVISYAAAFYLLSLALKYMPVGILYAVWSGFGIVMIAVIGFIVFGQKLDLWAILGLAMIIGGILVIHLLSSSTTH